MNATYLYQVWTSISDHSILVVREDYGVKRGPGQWHFSKDILEDDSICKRLEAVLLEELTEDIMLQWEMLKIHVQDVVQEFTKFCRKQKVNELHSLQRLLREIN